MDTENAPVPDEVPLRARGWTIPILLALVVIAAAIGAGALIGSLSGSKEPKTVTFVVPKGTAERALNGETIEIMPELVDLNVGDSLVVVNNDVEVAMVGPFMVRPGETLRQHFRQPQTLTGECSLSDSGEINIVVT